MPKNVWPQKNFGQHFFLTKFVFSIQQKLYPHFFWPEKVLTPILFWPNFGLIQKKFGPTFLWPKFFLTKIFWPIFSFGQKKFDQIFFGQKWILTNFVSRQIKIRPKKKFEQKKFQPKLSNSHYYNLNQIIHDLGFGFGIWDSDLGSGTWDSGFGIQDLGPET